MTKKSLFTSVSFMSHVLFLFFWNHPCRRLDRPSGGPSSSLGMAIRVGVTRSGDTPRNRPCLEAVEMFVDQWMAHSNSCSDSNDQIAGWYSDICHILRLIGRTRTYKSFLRESNHINFTSIFDGIFDAVTLISNEWPDHKGQLSHMFIFGV